MSREDELQAALDECRRRLDELHGASLAELRAAGEELAAMRGGLEAAEAEIRARFETARVELLARLAAVEGELAATRRRLAAVEGSRTYRVARAVRRVVPGRPRGGGPS